jgi:hypothetical protein
LLQERSKIRKLITSEAIEEAINQINDLNPEILEDRRDLYFRLQIAKLVRLIKQQKIQESLAFAQGSVAPLAAKNVLQSL